MWENVVDTRKATEGNMKQHVRFSCWISNSTDIHRVCNNYCFFKATMVSITRHLTFICILHLWLFLTANICDLSRKVKVILVDMLIILKFFFFFCLGVNIFLTLTIYQDTQEFSLLISVS